MYKFHWRGGVWIVALVVALKSYFKELLNSVRIAISIVLYVNVTKSTKSRAGYNCNLGHAVLIFVISAWC